jgi:hypothetical protein
LVNSSTDPTDQILKRECLRHSGSITGVSTGVFSFFLFA